MEVDYKWRFPKLDYGKRRGYSDGGEENFRENTIESLVREICQNSLDARKEDATTVVIEFERFKMNTDKIPDKEGLLKAIEGGINIWQEDDEDDRVVKLLKEYKRIITNNEVDVLRISDFNTRGLNGVDSKKSTPWNALVKSTGCSNKSGSAGGSYGIGKQAAFTCSKMKTIFYSTYNEEGVWAYEGTGEFPTLNVDGEDTQGTIYFGMQGNKAVLDKFSLNEYIRRETGTDIYIFAFQEITEEDFLNKIIVNVVENFLLAIHNENLVVKVMNEIISKESLQKYIEKYFDDYKYAVDYFKVLNSPNTHEKNYELGNLGEEGNVRLRILQEEDLSKTIYLSRSNGMKIDDKNRMKQYKPFSGILEINGKRSSEIFRAMEDVTHKKWSPNFIKDNSNIDYKYAKSLYKELNDFVKDFLQELNPIDETNEMDVYGLGAYFPDDFAVDIEEIEKKETISNSIKNEINVKTRKTKITNRVYMDDETEKTGSKDDSDDDTKVRKEEKKKKKTNSKKDKKSKIDNNGDEKLIEKKIVPLESIRLIMQEEANKYKLLIQPKENVEKVNISIYAKGESGTEKIEIVNAILEKSSWIGVNKKLEIKENIIQLKELKEGLVNIIEFETLIQKRCCMEVEVYELR